jgi:hypothetical protein
MISKMRQRVANSNALLISLTIHIGITILIACYPLSHRIWKPDSSIDVDWVKDVPDPELKRELPKQPIPKIFDPSRELTLKDKKASKASPDKVPKVKKRSNRLVERSVEINEFKRSDEIPDIMTAAQIRESYSNISGMISTDPGPVDGRGIVGNQVRAAGNGKSGASIMGLDGTGDGLVGGGGDGGGLLDRLGIISFMRESDGPQKVVYCLDVSSSMTMGAKLPISIRSLKESMMQLSDFDEFNIVTFHSGVSSFKKKAIQATIPNLEKAERFLDSFTPRNIEGNRGTDILTALKYALRMEPSVIVLITDIQPTQGEIDENVIAEEVRKINKNTRIYGIGVEVWEPSPTGRLAKLLKLLTEQNDGEMRLASSG